MREKERVYLYTRVSTAMQTDGYSLEAQRQKILDFAKFRDFAVVGEYSDAGFSGKNIAGRKEFQQMLSDIESRKDKIRYVLVFKLSRFGRNCADTLNSLQFTPCPIPMPAAAVPLQLGGIALPLRITAKTSSWRPSRRLSSLWSTTKTLRIWWMRLWVKRPMCQRWKRR